MTIVLWEEHLRLITDDSNIVVPENSNATHEDVLKVAMLLFLDYIDAATQSAENIITRICDAIVRVENTTIKAQLDDESIQKLKELHDQWLGQEKLTFPDHHQQQEANWQKHSQRLTNIVKNNEGVWISTKLFFIVGSSSLLSIITIAMEIAFYVYFKWIA